MAVEFATMPLDTQLEVLGWLPDFPSLHSCLLLNRTFSQLFTAHRPYLTKSVAQNHFGDLLEDALILANTQSKRRYSGPKNRSYKSGFIQKLMNNEAVLEQVQSIVFDFLINKNARRSKWSKETRRPTQPELLRFKRAAYRFWTFSTVERSKRSWFLSLFPVVELSEIANFYFGVDAWVSEMYSPEALCFESEHEADRYSAVLSSGLGRLAWLWELFMEMIHNPEDEYAFEIFEESIGGSGDGDGEGFFTYAFHDCWSYRHINIKEIQPILDQGHEKLKEILHGVNEGATVADKDVVEQK
ncbi:hypothetical protein DFH09DRAFT_1378461 [Mycena vulgaris]|nr:hypothetical protein DFH09DRAFT_1378461 [Mycena vulgaris]